MIHLDLKKIAFVSSSTLNHDVRIRRILKLYRLLVVSEVQFNEGAKQKFEKNGFVLQEKQGVTVSVDDTEILRLLNHAKIFLISIKKFIGSDAVGVLVIVEDFQKAMEAIDELTKCKRVMTLHSW